jgi:hypothetical protein
MVVTMMVAAPTFALLESSRCRCQKICRCVRSSRIPNTRYTSLSCRSDALLARADKVIELAIIRCTCSGLLLALLGPPSMSAFAPLLGLRLPARCMGDIFLRYAKRFFDH